MMTLGNFFVDWLTWPFRVAGDRLIEALEEAQHEILAVWDSWELA